MRRFALIGCLFVAAVPAALAAPDCMKPIVAQPLSAGQAMLSAVAPELRAHAVPLGTPSGVLAHAYDESQSVDRVLLRMRMQACQNVAMALPAPTIADPNDPAAYKPKTEFDNTPWRFDMNQNGKRMTAVEFDAWMKARGVRVAKGAAPALVPLVQPVTAPIAEPVAEPVAVPETPAPIPN